MNMKISEWSYQNHKALDAWLPSGVIISPVPNVDDDGNKEINSNKYTPTYHWSPY